MSEDDFDPVIANSAVGTGLAIMYNDKTIKTYKNVWAVFAVDEQDSENRYYLTTDIRPNADTVNTLISDKTELDGYFWSARLVTYYIAHVSRNFENLFINAFSRGLGLENINWDPENNSLTIVNEPEFSSIDDQGFFGHGGWTSAINLD